MLITGVSESNLMQKLAVATDEMSDEMSVEQMRLFQAYVTKALEAKEAKEAFRAAANLESDADLQTSETLREIRITLEDQNIRLSGSESVLLASYHKLLEGDEHLDTKRINIFLHSFDRKPSNSTKIVDILSRKNLIESRSDGPHAHKTFSLTRAGEDQVRGLLVQLQGSAGTERLAVVK